MSKYKKGQRIQIKESVSPNGKYGAVAGYYGVISHPGHEFAPAITEIRLDTGQIFSYVSANVLHLVPSNVSMEPLERMEQEYERMHIALMSLKEKIDFMKETKTTKFNKIEFKIYKAFLEIQNDTNLSPLEKARKVASFIKG